MPAVATEVTFVGAAAASNWSFTLPNPNVQVPAGVERGDLIVLQVRVNDDSSVAQWDPGANGFRFRSRIGEPGGAQWLYTRLCDGTESGSLTVQFSTGAAKTARMYLFRGQRGDDLLDLRTANGSTVTVTHPAIRAPEGYLAVALVSFDDAENPGPFVGATGGTWTQGAIASSTTRTVQLQTADMEAETLSGGSLTLTNPPSRWTTHAFALAPAAAAQSVHMKVLAEDPDGNLVDLSDLGGNDWTVSASYEHDIDAPVGTATVTLWRADSLVQSLAPLVVASTLNRNAAAQYAPLLVPNRRLVIQTAVTEEGREPDAAYPYRTVFDGTQDRVDWGDDLIITIQARDLGAELQDRWIETPTFYGDDGGTETAQDVIQQILDDWIGPGAIVLYTPVAPDPPALIHEYEQQVMSVMDAIKAVANGHGWDVRYIWDPVTGAYRLTYFEPGRTSTELAGASSGDLYSRVSTMAIGSEDVRNVISVIYTDGSTGEPDEVKVEDAASITNFGRKFAQLEFGPDSPIDTLDEATALANAALSDLADPFAEQEIELPYDNRLEIQRLYEFIPNDEHYDETQRFGSVRVRHDLEPERSTSTMFVRGKVAGQFAAWLRMGSGARPRDGIDGLTTEFRYRCSATAPATPVGNDPSGWTTSPPTCLSPAVLWMSSAQRHARSGQVAGDWTTPVRVTGPEGPGGGPGPPGEVGRIRMWGRQVGPGVADAVIEVQHDTGAAGQLSVWVNPSGVANPDPEGPPDGSVAFLSTTFVADHTTVFALTGGGTGALLNDIPVSAKEAKTLQARVLFADGGVAVGQTTLTGIIEVVDDFGVLENGSVDTAALALAAVRNPNVADRAIAVRNLVIGNFDDLLADGGFEAAGALLAQGLTSTQALNQAGWTLVSNGGTWSVVDTEPFVGTWCAHYNRAGQTATASLRSGNNSGPGAIQARPGQRYYFEAQMRRAGTGSTGSAAIQIIYRNAAGVLLGSNTSASATPGGSYQTLSVTGTPAPTGTAWIQFGCNVGNTGDAAGVRFDDCFAHRMEAGKLIVHGAIVADHMSANSVTANAIAANAILTVHLSADSVTAAKINVTTLDAITADVGILTAGRLQNASGTTGVLLSGSLPGGWTRYLNLTAGGSQAFLNHPALMLRADGSATFTGALSAATGTFGGSLTAAILNVSAGILNVPSGCNFSSAGALTISATNNADLLLRSLGGDAEIDGAAVRIGISPSTEIEIGSPSATLRFFSQPGATRRTVSGSWGGNAAGAALAAALEDYGLIVDSTT